VPVAFETYGTLGARGDAYLRDVVRNYVRPVTWLDAPADKGPKFVDHGGRYSIFLRRLRELISVTLQCGNAAFIRKCTMAGQLRPQERSGARRPRP